MLCVPHERVQPCQGVRVRIGNRASPARLRAGSKISGKSFFRIDKDEIRGRVCALFFRLLLRWGVAQFRREEAQIFLRFSLFLCVVGVAYGYAIGYTWLHQM